MKEIDWTKPRTPQIVAAFLQNYFTDKLLCKLMHSFSNICEVFYKDFLLAFGQPALVRVKSLLFMWETSHCPWCVRQVWTLLTKALSSYFCSWLELNHSRYEEKKSCSNSKYCLIMLESVSLVALMIILGFVRCTVFHQYFCVSW